MTTAKSQRFRDHFQISVRYLYKVCVTARTRWHVCLGKDIPEPQKRCWVGWAMGSSRTVINE